MGTWSIQLKIDDFDSLIMNLVMTCHASVSYDVILLENEYLYNPPEMKWYIGASSRSGVVSHSMGR